MSLADVENDDGGIGDARRARLDPLFVYGVKPEVRGGIYFAADNASVIYAAGCGVAQYNSKVRKSILRKHFSLHTVV